MLDPQKYNPKADTDTRIFREYMAKESVQQYRDYYETDSEEQPFFEYIDNMPNRDRIRFMEIYEDYTVDKSDQKDYMMIKKREYNPELSVFSNLVLDLQDFKDRVRPLAKDIAMMDVTRQYQKQNMKTLEREMEDFRETLQTVNKELKEEEGYSSKEIEEK